MKWNETTSSEFVKKWTRHENCTVLEQHHWELVAVREIRRNIMYSSIQRYATRTFLLLGWFPPLVKNKSNQFANTFCPQNVIDRRPVYDALPPSK